MSYEVDQSAGNCLPRYGERSLSEVRTEIVCALALFHEHVKYTITLMSAIIAFGLALPEFAIEKHIINARAAFIGSAMLFAAIAPLAKASLKICSRYYKIYASNYIFYARLHKYSGQMIEHPWVEDLYVNQGFTRDAPDVGIGSETGIGSSGALNKFMNAEGSLEPNSWVYYKKIINVFYFAGIGGSVAMIIQAICYGSSAESMVSISLHWR